MVSLRVKESGRLAVSGQFDALTLQLISQQPCARRSAYSDPALRFDAVEKRALHNASLARAAP
jgi:hypothetical protein